MIPLYLHYVKGFNGINIGLMLLPATAALAIFSPFVNQLTERLGAWKVLSFGFLLFAISAFSQSHFNMNTSIDIIVVVYLLIGLGWACILSPSFASALASVPQEKSGVATGTLGTLHNAGAGIGLTIGTFLFDQPTAQLSKEIFIQHQSMPFYFIGSVALLMCFSLAFKAKPKI